MTPSLEDQLRDAAREIEVPVEPPASLLRRVARRRRRQVVARCSAIGVVVVVAVGAVIVAAVDRPGPSAHPVQRLAIGAHATHRATPRAQANLAVLPTPPPPPTTAVPSQFYGAVGAGDERLAVIDASSGAVLRYLQPQGSQELSIFSPDRTVSYQPALSVTQCDSSWIATNLKTGAQQPAFTTLDRPGEVALSPVGQRVAYVSVGRPKMVQDPGGRERSAGCPTAAESLVVVDQGTGTQLRIPLGHFGEAALYPAFDDSGNLLAVKWHGRIRVLDLARDTSMDQAAIVPSNPGCDQTKPSFRPGDDQLLVAVDCSTYAGINGYDASTWRPDYHHVAAHQPSSFLASYAVDASGQHVIYSVDVGNGGPQGAVYVIGQSGDRHVTDGVYQVEW
jgi:hypothetical protein